MFKKRNKISLPALPCEHATREDRGQLICIKCGLIQGSILSVDAKYPDEQYPLLTHVALTDKNLGTYPPSTFQRTVGNTTPTGWAWRRNIRRAAIAYGIPRHEKRLRFILNYLDSLGAALQLPRHIRQLASISYQKIYRKIKGRGRKRECILCGLLLACARQGRYPLSLRDIQKVMNFSRRDITMISSNAIILARALQFPIGYAEVPPRLYLVTTEMGLPSKITLAAEQIYRKIKKLPPGVGFGGYTTETLIGGAILYSAQKQGYPINIEKLAEEINLTKVTLMNGASRVEQLLE